MVIDTTLTPQESRRVKRVLVNGVDVTRRCYRVDTETGTAWLFPLDEQQRRLRVNVDDPVWVSGRIEVEWHET